METRLTLLTQLPNRWPEFVSLYQPFLARVVRSSGVRSQDVHDIVQNVFVSLVRRMPSFQYDSQAGRFRGWLRRIVQNAVIDFYRSEAGRRGTLEREMDRQQHHNPEVISSLEADAEQRRHVLENVLSVVQRESKPLTWSCFSQHLLQGRAARDVASELQISPNAVYVNASRVLERVRNRCAEFHEELVE